VIGTISPFNLAAGMKKAINGAPFLKGAAFTWCIGINDVTLPNAATIAIIARIVVARILACHL